MLTVSFPKGSTDTAYYSRLHRIFVASALLHGLYSSVLHCDAFQRTSFSDFESGSSFFTIEKNPALVSENGQDCESKPLHSLSLSSEVMGMVSPGVLQNHLFQYIIANLRCSDLILEKPTIY